MKNHQNLKICTVCTDFSRVKNRTNVLDFTDECVIIEVGRRGRGTPTISTNQQIELKLIIYVLAIFVGWYFFVFYRKKQIMN